MITNVADFIDNATTHYLAALVWTATCNGTAEHDGCDGEDCMSSLDDIGYTVADVNATHRDAARSDVADFINGCLSERPDVFDGMTAEQTGHDFALTRNHHGAGFWDRGHGERGEWLTKMSHPHGSAEVYADGTTLVYQG